MSIRFIEGFDVIQAAGAAVDANFVRRWTPDAGGLPSTKCTLVAGRLGGLALHHLGGFAGGDALIMQSMQLAAAHRYVTVGFAFKKSTSVLGYLPILMDALDNPQIYLSWTASGGLDRIMIRSGDPAGVNTLLGTYDVDLGVDWHYFEFEVILSTSVALGSANLFIDGALVLAVSGVATAVNNNGVGSFSINSMTGGTGTFDIDDLYVATSSNTPTGYQGDAVVEETLPTSNGATMDATPVGAANVFQCVDDPTNATDDDATYGELIGVNKVALFGFPATTDYEETILAVEVEEIVRTSAGVNPFHAAEVAHGVDQATSTPTTTIGGTYGNVSNIMEVDPITGAEWDIDDINAAEFGIRQT